MSANKISKNFIKSRFLRISGFFPHPFFADPNEYWIQMLHTHNLSDISLTVLPAYPPVFHMPADLFFHILKPLIPLRKRSALLRIGGSIKTDHTDFLQHHRQQIQKD